MTNSKAEKKKTVQNATESGRTIAGAGGSTGAADGEADYIGFDDSGSSETEETPEPALNTKTALPKSPLKRASAPAGSSSSMIQQQQILSRQSTGSIQQKRTSGRNDFSNVDILSLTQQTVPWIPENRKYSRHLTDMLTEEIHDFYDHITSSYEEHHMREWIVERVEEAAKSIWPKCQVSVFGSFETKLYLPTSDIDIAVEEPTMSLQNQMTYLADVLRKRRIGEDIQVIDNARVPIIKFRDRLTKYNVDISFDQRGGTKSAEIIKDYLRHPTIGEAIPRLLVALKHFLFQRNYNEPFKGHLGGYALGIHVISFLLLHPKLGNNKPAKIDAMQNLGALLIEFFELYGRLIDFNECGVGLDDKGNAWYFNKPEYFGGQRSHYSAKFQHPVTLDPADKTNDVTRSAYNFSDVRHQYNQAYGILTTVINKYHVLCATNPRSPPPRPKTLLGTILFIKKNDFDQREVVKQVYRDMVRYDWDVEKYFENKMWEDSGVLGALSYGYGSNSPYRRKRKAGQMDDGNITFVAASTDDGDHEESEDGTELNIFRSSSAKGKQRTTSQTGTNNNGNGSNKKSKSNEVIVISDSEDMDISSGSSPVIVISDDEDAGEPSSKPGGKSGKKKSKNRKKKPKNGGGGGPNGGNGSQGNRQNSSNGNRKQNNQSYGNNGNGNGQGHKAKISTGKGRHIIFGGQKRKRK